VIVGIGVDLCDVARIERALTASSGAAFRRRIFTDVEQAYCDGHGRRVRFESYAARFAAKEAALKALGTGWSGGIGFTDVEVLRADDGTPTLRLHGVAAAAARKRRIVRWHVSLTHTDTLAVATVVAEASRPVRAAVPSRTARPDGAAAGSAPRRPRSRPATR
jgi:holo-[acyl-carrier protein] synthase